MWSAEAGQYSGNVSPLPLCMKYAIGRKARSISSSDSPTLNHYLLIIKTHSHLQTTTTNTSNLYPPTPTKQQPSSCQAPEELTSQLVRLLIPSHLPFLRCRTTSINSVHQLTSCRARRSQGGWNPRQARWHWR